MMKSISLICSSSATLMRLLILSSGLISLIFSTYFAIADDSSNHKILILGDSLSAAYGIRRQEGWAYLLQTKLAEHAIVNASVSGETTAGGLQRLPPLIKEHQPSIIIIELGGNDGLRGYPTSTIRKNLQTLITKSMDAGAKVLLIGMQIPPNYGKRYTDAFEQNYVQLADKYTLALVPFLLESVAGKPALMQRDGIHPTAAAQPLILQNVLPALLSMLD